MRHMRGTEQKVPRPHLGHPILHPVPSRPSGNEINLVAQMRNLRPIGRTGGEPELQITVPEHLDGAARRPWQRQGGGKPTLAAVYDPCFVLPDWHSIKPRHQGNRVKLSARSSPDRAGVSKEGFQRR